MKIKPLQDRIIISRLQAKDKTQGGIYIPDTAQEKTTEGMVVAIGEGRVLDNGTRIPTDVVVGNTVLFEKGTGTDVDLNGEQFVVLEESNIIGVIEN